MVLKRVSIHLLSITRFYPTAAIRRFSTHRFHRLSSKVPAAGTVDLTGRDERTFPVLGHPIKKATLPANAEFEKETDHITGTSNLNQLHMETCDVCVIGGGLLGASIAFWTNVITHRNLKIVVIERDFSYKLASTMRGLGTIRPQYSLAENIQMSTFSHQFLRYANRMLSIERQPPVDVKYHPHGSLICFCNPEHTSVDEYTRFQYNCGAQVRHFTGDALLKRFPWLNVEHVRAASLCVDGGGWFDVGALTAALLNKAVYEGVELVEAEVAALEASEMERRHRGNSSPCDINCVLLRFADGRIQRLRCANIVVAAGAGSNAVLSLIEGGHSNLNLTLTKRYVYRLEAENAPCLNFPLVLCPERRLYVRREGYNGHYLCVHSPAGTPDDPEPSPTDLSVPSAESAECGGGEYFNRYVRPALGQLVPALHDARLLNVHAGLYDFGALDGCPFVGRHHIHASAFVAAGFGGVGGQHAPAVGRAIAELITTGAYKSIDLSRFDPGRYLENLFLREELAV